MLIPTLALVTTILFNCKVNGQPISSHKWKDRVLIILTDEERVDRLHRQVNILQTDQEGLKDRKLVIYSVKGDAYRKGINSDQWVNGSNFFEAFKDSELNFKVILIGLDGGIKINQSEVLSLDELFNTIDAMPMRRSELRTRNQ